MAYDVRLVIEEPHPTAVVRRRASQAQLAQVVPQACGEVWQFVQAHAVPNPDRHIAVYLDGEINLEVGVLVGAPIAGDGQVFASQTPAGEVATTVHMGPYQRLGDAHRAIHDWCAVNGRELAGPSWEIYGHGTDDPAQMRTDVFYLLKPRG